jgi:aspartate 1-decarboxylase
VQSFFLKAKIHRVTVTGADPDYEGSISVDTLLMEAAGMSPFEQVHVYNVSNGRRFVTYLMEGARGTGEITVNGAAAHLVETGHLLIIAAYCMLEPDEIAGWKPAVVLVDAANRHVVRK